MRTLTSAEREQFRDEGFVMLPDVLPTQRLARLRAAVAAMVEERERYRGDHPDLIAAMREAEARGEVVHATEWTHVVMHMYQLWERLPSVREHSLDPVLGELAREALGVPALRLWFDQAMIKEAGGGPTPFHQDNTYMPIDPESAGVITIWSPLGPVTADMGCLRYVAGSHRGPRLPPIPLTGWDDIRSLLDDPSCLDTAVAAEVPEGGVVMHHGNVIHGANPNITDLPRPVVLTCYYPDRARRAGPFCQYVIDRDRVAIGEPLVGPGLPLVAGAPRPTRFRAQH
jgi:ectoine hydroxylase-related dioxygenase (phytanoyl-CoA dioxygenase family)